MGLHRRRLIVGLAAGALAGCHDRGRPRVRDGKVVFRNRPLWEDPSAFQRILDRFEKESALTVGFQTLPSETDVAHQFFLTSLEGGDDDFDVLLADVIWIPEFARAGWIADLSPWFPPEKMRAEIVPGPVEAVVVDGRTRAVPWFVDVGVLYRRTDQVPEPPTTLAALETAAAAALEAGLAGYAWQGRQYEGLVCNAFEAIWAHGGVTLSPGGRLLVDTPEARTALSWMRSLIRRRLSPASTTTATEEPTRRLFQSGKAALLRNWPYVWTLANAADSPIRGRVGYSPLPSLTGAPGHGCLGGWQLAVNANIPRARMDDAAAFIAALTSPEANLELAIAYAQLPPRRAVYDDPRLKESAPFIAGMLPSVEQARPRPVTPYYDLLADPLQSELSAAITGWREPAEALARAQQQADRIVGSGS